jgi:hypothetical protein
MAHRRSGLLGTLVIQLQVVLAASSAALIGAAPSLLNPLVAQAYTGASLVQNVSPITTGLPGVAQYYGGREEELAIDPTNANIVFSASELGGLYKSTTGGASWSHVDSLPMTAMRGVKIAPTDHNLVVVSGNPDSHVSDQGGIWRSTDGGGTWTHVGDPCTPSYAFGLDIAPTGTPGHITIVVTNLCGLMVSTDSGATWNLRFPPGACCSQFWDVKATVVSGHVQVDTCGNPGFFRSADAGATWSPVDNTSPVNMNTGNANSPCEIAVAPGDPNTVFIASYDKSPTGCGSQLYETDNANNAAPGSLTPPTWTDMKPCGNGRNGRRPWVITHPSVTSDATKFEVYFGNTTRVDHQTCSYSTTPRCKVGSSNDSGNWAMYDGALPHNGSDPTDIAFDPSSPNGCPVLESGDGGVFKMLDCTSTPAYSTTNTGLNALDALLIAGSVYTSPAHTDIYFGTQDNGLYASTDGAATWRDVALWDIYGLIADHNGPGSKVLYRTCCGDGIGQANEDFSSNTGWGTQPPLPPGTSVPSNDFWTQFGPGSYGWMTPDSSTPAKWTLYATTTNGASWTQVGPSPLPGGPSCCSGAGELQASGPSASPTFYLHLAVGGLSKIYKVAGPLNNTATLTDVTGTLVTPAFLAVNPANPSQLYTWDYGPQKVMRSTDGAATWVADNVLTSALSRGGLFNVNGQVSSIAFDSNSSAILAGTNDAGIFASLDGGQTWVYVRGSDVIPRIPNFFFDERTLDIYAASNGRGVWKVNVAPQSQLSIGTPRFPNVNPQFVTSATPFTLSAVGRRTVASVSYRYYLQGAVPPAYTTVAGTSTTFSLSGADGKYVVDTFATDTAGSEETPKSLTIRLDNTAPTSTLSVGTPRFPMVSPHFITSASALTLSATDAGSGVASVSFRVFAQGSPPPAYVTVAGSSTVFTVHGPDGNYEIDTFATDNLGNVEATHVLVLYLDNTPPVITIVQPTATNYPHSATLILNYTVTDGAGSGVQSVTATMDGSTTLAGHGLASGQAIWLLVELPLGPHTFKVAAVDNVGNADSSSVTFNIIVTPASIQDDVKEFCSKGFITKTGICNSLLAKLRAAARQFTRGNCDASGHIYEAFIHELQAQSGKAIDPTAAAIMTGDANYLIQHCP